MSHRADRRSAYPSGFRNHLLHSRGDGAAHYTTAPVKRWSAMLMSAVSMVLVSCALEHSSDAAPATAEEKILLTPDALSWRPIPREWVEGARPPGFKGGSEVAILQGDPSQQGRPYVIRFRSPPGSQLPPIWASDDESLRSSPVHCALVWVQSSMRLPVRTFPQVRSCSYRRACPTSQSIRGMSCKFTAPVL